jgi:hypothetical protein
MMSILTYIAIENHNILVSNQLLQELFYFPPFMAPENPLLHLQEPATGLNMNHMNAVNILSSTSLKSILILSNYLCLGLPNGRLLVEGGEQVVPIFENV